jgi:hypothetical protein
MCTASCAENKEKIKFINYGLYIVFMLSKRIFLIGAETPTDSKMNLPSKL